MKPGMKLTHFSQCKIVRINGYTKGQRRKLPKAQREIKMKSEKRKYFIISDFESDRFFENYFEIM